MPEVFFPAHKQVSLNIDGKQYTATAFLSMGDSEAFITAPVENYRQTVASFVYKRLICEEEEKPPVERIMQQEDTTFEPLIKALLSQSETFRRYYEKQEGIDDICLRLVLAVRDEYIVLSKTLADSIKAAIPKIIVPPVFQVMENLRTTLQNLTTPINDLVKSIRIPTLTEEQKEKILEAHKQWGEYGWTQPPASDMGFFREAPPDMKSANELALAYCQNKDMQEVFSLLHGMKGVKKSDIEEAVFDFEHRKYKSCVLVLFGLIDAKLIRLQRDEDRTSKGKRRTGQGASKKLFARIQQEKSIDKKVYLLFSWQNLYSCLLAVFADGDDFKKQPEVINRNFVDHGMIHRKVTRRDCIQIFLLYYNLLEFLDVIYGG